MLSNLRDLSYSAAQVHEPLTPIELQLKRAIQANYPQLEMRVFQELSPYGVSLDDTQDYLRTNLTRNFYAYIEQRYPVASPDVKPFLEYTTSSAIAHVEKQQAQQRAFDRNRYQRTLDPRGMSCMPHPEVT